MGRPIKKEFIGGSNVPSGQEMLVIDSAFIPGASEVSTNVKIVSQKGTGRYVVTDGTNTGLVSLVDGSNDYVPVLGEAVSKVSVFVENPQPVDEFTPKAITLNAGGTGYAVDDVITLTNAGTVKVSTVSVATSAGEILTGVATLSTNSSATDMADTGVSATGGKGTGATFDITSTKTTNYTPKAITLNAGGTGYAVDDVITLTNAGTVKVSTVDTNGVITAITPTLATQTQTSDMAGTSVSGTGGTGTGATFDITSTSVDSFTPKAITLNAPGVGYAAKDNLTIPNAGTYLVSTVSDEIPAGEILTITSTLLTDTFATDMAGTGIAGIGGTGTGATFDITSTKSYGILPIVEYASKIFNRTVTTFEDNVYAWNVDVKANQDGEADLTTIKKS